MNAAVAGRPAVEFDTVATGEWDRIVGDFADGSYEQTACYADARWGSSRTSHLLLRRAGVPVAGARVVMLGLRGLPSGLAYVKFGPFWRRRDADPEPPLYRLVLSALVDEYCGRRGHCLTILPRSTPDFYAEECQALDELGFAVRRPMVDPRRYLVDLRIGDARLEALDQKWRYNLRLALRADIDCRLADGDAGFAMFGAMHAAMVGRKRYRDTDRLDVLPELTRRVQPSMRPHVVVASHDGVPVAGAVVAVCGDTAFYLFGASTDAALPLRAGYALHWWIVSWAADRGARWYDLGGEAMSEGLRQFKKGLVGKRGAVLTMRGEFDRWTSRRGRLVADCIYALRDLGRTTRGVRERLSARPRATA
jgi:GNAT acetyltransferase-like protein